MNIQKRLGLLSILALFAVFFVLDRMKFNFSSEPPLVLPLLNTLFIGIVSIVSAFIASKIYLSSNLFSVLLIGDGMLIFGLGASIAGWLRFLPNGANVNVTIFNTSALLGSALCFIGAIRRVIMSKKLIRGKGSLVCTVLVHIAVGVVLTIVTLVTLNNLIPTFFVQGLGPTMLRQIVISCAIVLNYAASIIFFILYSRTKSGYLFWLCLSLGMTASGLSIVAFGAVTLGSPINWIGRGGIYFGGLFSLFAILSLIISAKEKGLSLDKTLAAFFTDAEASYKSLVETTADAIICTDQEFRIFQANSAAKKMFGYNDEEMIGIVLIDSLLPSALKETVQSIFEQNSTLATTQQQYKTTELKMSKKDGDIIPVEASISSRLISMGWVHTYIIRDITDRKKTEAELEKYQQHLEELVTDRTNELTEQNIELQIQKQQLDTASQMKSTFLSNMSHELRTPLNSVISLTSVLTHRLQGKIPDQEYGYLDVIERNGKNLLDLVNDILDLSRIEAGKEEISLRQIHLQQLVAEIIDVFDVQAKNKGIVLLNSMDMDLPIICSDREKCRHILQNIIGNALKFTSHGEVEITALIVNDDIEIAVRDTGVGIASEHLEMIFDEFRQVDETNTRKNGGTGLGLAIARKYAQMLGGLLTMQSKMGQGSVFTLKLPKKIKDITIDLNGNHSEVTEECPEFSADILAFKTIRHILLVEDSEPAIIQITDMLSEQGCFVQSVRSGKDALAYIDKIRPDGVILDLMMPEMDGFEVLKMIRSTEKNSSIPVLILTAKQITKEELTFLKNNHVTQLIQKGMIDKKDLLKAIDAMISSTDQKLNDSPGPIPIQKKTRPVVLIVEDNPDNMVTVKAILSDTYDILEAFDGRNGIEQAIQHIPDLILMDISLPLMDGIQTLKSIRQLENIKHIPVIAVTARAMYGDRDELISQGFNGYVSKPIDPEKLDKAVRRCIYGD